MPLHLTKVAYSCASLDTLERRVERWSANGEIRIPTRMRPKRADECVGGKLHYILKHRIVARVEILRFEERRDGRIDIVCSDRLEVVSPMPKRAHQGWRYLEEKNAPPDLAEGELASDAMPGRLVRELSKLGLA